MEIITITCIALLVICGYLCYENDKLSIQIKHDEQWKVAADRRIKELQEENSILQNDNEWARINNLIAKVENELNQIEI